MRFDFCRPSRQLFGASNKADLISLRAGVSDAYMRISDRCLLQLGFYRVWPLLIMAFHLHFDQRAMRAVPLQLFLLVDVRLVLGRITLYSKHQKVPNSADGNQTASIRHRAGPTHPDVEQFCKPNVVAVSRRGVFVRGWRQI